MHGRLDPKTWLWLRTPNLLAKSIVVILSYDILTTAFVVLYIFENTVVLRAIPLDALSAIADAIHYTFTNRHMQESMICFGFVLVFVLVVNCYIAMSFLGLYGMFTLQLLGLVTF